METFSGMIKALFQLLIDPSGDPLFEGRRDVRRLGLIRTVCAHGSRYARLHTVEKDENNQAGTRRACNASDRHV